MLVVWESKEDMSVGSSRQSCGRRNHPEVYFICSGFGEGDGIAKRVVAL